MTADQINAPQSPPPTWPRDSGIRQRTAFSPWRWLGLAIVVVAAGGLAAYSFTASQETKQSGKSAEARTGHHQGEKSLTAKVQVVKPERGGMERVTKQPGTIRAFEFAPLYTKISGFVEELNVDRGSVVKKGQLLAKIYDPERDVAVLQAQADLDHAKATVDVAQAGILKANASVLAAKANTKAAKATLDDKIAQRDFRKKEYERISDLVARRSAEERLKDEQLDDWHSSEAAVLAAEAGIETAAAQLDEAQAKVELAVADLKAAKARVLVADANLKAAHVFVEYTKIRSPYDGVVIFRGEGVHPGAFVRAATEGSSEPLLTVAYTKKMRTIVPIPDSQVPYCDVGDPAIITLDALAGRAFEARVSRIAESEDLSDRTMRVEIDLDNPEGILKDGMFGRATILLEKLVKNISIPSSCLVDRNGKGEGAVMVVRDGRVHKVNVHVGMDTGVRVEIIDGLADDDLVILQPDASIADGTAVQTEVVTSASAQTREKPSE
jgi:RND family efflux transporter MFP subunit